RVRERAGDALPLQHLDHGVEVEVLAADHDLVREAALQEGDDVRDVGVRGQEDRIAVGIRGDLARGPELGRVGVDAVRVEVRDTQLVDVRVPVEQVRAAHLEEADADAHLRDVTDLDERQDATLRQLDGLRTREVRADAVLEDLTQSGGPAAAETPV